MKIPDIHILDHGIWRNSKKCLKTSARFLLTYELEFHSKSNGETIINNIAYPTKDRSIVFVRPGDIRYSKYSSHDTSVMVHFFYFVLAPEKDGIFEDMLNKIPTCIEADSELQNKWEQLASAVENTTDSISEMQLYVQLLLFLTSLAQKGTEETESNKRSNQQQAVFEAIRYMYEHVTDALPVSKIADHIGYSPSRFNSIFKIFTGRTPHSYYISLKISEAKYMLLNTDKSISEISEALSFSKTSMFHAAFKKMCHTTPGQFRKNRYAVFYHDD